PERAAHVRYQHLKAVGAAAVQQEPGAGDHGRDLGETSSVLAESRTTVSPSAASIAAITAGSSFTPDAATFDAICSGRDAPTSAAATFGFCSTHAIASCGIFRPTSSA